MPGIIKRGELLQSGSQPPLVVAAADGRSGPESSGQGPRPLATAKPWTGKTPEGSRTCRDIGPITAIPRCSGPANVTKEFFTKEELVADEKRRAAQRSGTN